MKTIKQVTIEPVFIDIIPELLEQNKFYISRLYRTASHLCLCGCGNVVVTPIQPPLRWDLIEHEDGRVSLIGSVGSYNLPCKSHYIITKNIANFC